MLASPVHDVVQDLHQPAPYAYYAIAPAPPEAQSSCRLAQYDQTLAHEYVYLLSARALKRRQNYPPYVSLNPPTLSLRRARFHTYRH